jgi:crotonobetainyl-CoA:carnitine CoA-transferase CaiB-like acyl-CoA transferase
VRESEKEVNNSLEGVRIVECGTGAGAAFCASLLNELGAQVTKIIGPIPTGLTERAEIRRLAEETYLDVGKNILQGVIGDESFLELVRQSHIVVRGKDPIDGDAALLRKEYESLKSINPDLIYVALTPFGTFGPGSQWSGSDLNAQAISGWTWIVGNPEEAPLSINYDMGPLQQGLGAAGAALVALLERGSEGAGGEFVDVSEADVISACMRMYSLAYRFLNIPMNRNGLRAPGSSGRYPHTILPCKDGYISTICRSSTDWGRFIEMMGDPAWAKEPRYNDFFKMGTEYPDEVDALIIPWLMQHTKAEMGQLAVQYRVPLAPVCTIEEALENEQFAYRGFFVEREINEMKVRVPGAVATWTPNP